MLTKLIINNFKKFDTVEIDLGSPVVFIGPNNSGKTTALQALSLWEIAYNKWIDKRGSDKETAPVKRPGITINRKDLISLPISVSNLLWKDKRTHISIKEKEQSRTENIFIDVIVEGKDIKSSWKCGFEFYYANEESFYCRPVRLSNDKNPKRMPIPGLDERPRIAFLPPMSGLADREFLKQHGEIDFLIGQGQTAQVLRNLCYKVYMDFPQKWVEIVNHIRQLFGINLMDPQYTERSEIIMGYEEPSGVKLDLSASGRGVQQTLLLLAHLYANPNSILLFDEPDAHLEILRQRQNFNLISEVAGKLNSQIIAASHSEVVLNEAAGTGTVVAFVGKPHIINEKTTQILKSLTTIGFEQYYQAEQKGWVLYVENSSDLAILKAFAEKINHPSKDLLQAPFVFYIATNLPGKARDHFWGLREAKNNLIGVAIFDRIQADLNIEWPLYETMWNKREIENYFCLKEVFLNYAASLSENSGPLFEEITRKKNIDIMNESIKDLESAIFTLGKGSPWTDDFKVSDEFMEPLFRKFSEKLSVPLVLRKNEFYKLINFLPDDFDKKEISEKLDLIEEASKRAKPVIE